jgi:hypothetical protein
MDNLPKKMLQERDMQVYQLRKSGLALEAIASKTGLSVGQVQGAVQRQLGRLNKDAVLAYPEVLRMELERLDALQAALWPKTQTRRVQLDDGEEVTVEPDERAIAQVLGIMAQRQKLLGMDRQVVDVQVDVSNVPDVRSTLEGVSAATQSSVWDPESEAKALLALAREAGIVDEAVASTLMGDGDIIEAEIVDEDPAG